MAYYSNLLSQDLTNPAFVQAYIDRGSADIFSKVLSPFGGGNSSGSDDSLMSLFETSSESGGLGTAEAVGGVVTGIADAGAQISGNIMSYRAAKDNYHTAQVNALSLFSAAEDNARLMREEAGRREAANVARSSRTGLQRQAFDNLMMSDRIQAEKEIMSMKEAAQFEAVSLLNSARRIKSRQKRKSNVSGILTVGITAPLAVVGGIFGGPAGAALGLKAGNAITQGVTSSMSNGR